jgi:hypothetical protein
MQSSRGHRANIDAVLDNQHQHRETAAAPEPEARGARVRRIGKERLGKRITQEVIGS